MNYSISTIPNFDKQAKQLAKKYASIGNDLAQLANSLKESPTQGESLGKHCHKVRMAITSKGRGKSAGARIITLVKVIDEQVILLSIYDKSQKDSISDQELQGILDGLEDWKKALSIPNQMKMDKTISELSLYFLQAKNLR